MGMLVYVPWYPGLGCLAVNRVRQTPFPLTAGVDRVHFFSYCRYAIRAAVVTLGLRPGDKILAPAYICEAALLPFREFGIRVELFPVAEDFSVDPADVGRRLRSSAARLVLLVHYFGFPQPGFSDVLHLCDDHQVPLLEDAAHGFLSCYSDGTPLGSRGHISCFSFRKTLGLPHGAALVLNRVGTGQFQLPAASVDWLQSVRSVAGKAADSLSVRLGWSVRQPVARRSEPVVPKGGYTPSRGGMSGISRWLLAHADFERVRNLRRHNFLLWLHELVGCDGVSVLFPELPEWVVPLVFPIRVRNPDMVQRALFQAGVESMRWWASLPDMTSQEYGTAIAVSKELLVLPVHQDVSADAIRYGSRIVRDVVSASRGGA